MERLKEGDIVMYREEDGTPGCYGQRYKVLGMDPSDGSISLLLLGGGCDCGSIGTIYHSFHPDRYYRIDEEESGSDQSGP